MTKLLVKTLAGETLMNIDSSEVITIRDVYQKIEHAYEIPQKVQVLINNNHILTENEAIATFVAKTPDGDNIMVFQFADPKILESCQKHKLLNSLPKSISVHCPTIIIYSMIFP